jgi:hypothetical protein
MDTTAMVARCTTRFQDENNVNVTVAGWVGYLNDAYRDVVSSSPLWPFLKQETQALIVLAGTRSIALPANTLRVSSVYNNTDQYPMRVIEGDTQHIRYYPDQTLTGPPSRYRIFNNKLEVWTLPEVDTTFWVDYWVAPGDLGSGSANIITSHAGAAAGDINIPGIVTADTLVSVVGVKTSDQSVLDFSSQFTIPAAATINNTGGTATTGYTLIVTYIRASVVGANTPVFPAQWHNLLVEGALARASIDDSQPAQAKLYVANYAALLMAMHADLLSGQQQQAPQIVDSWY